MKRFRPMLRFALVCFEAALISACGSVLAAAQNLCQFNSAQGKIQHVIYIQFDNVHLRRDNPNVPSDLEQMPNLLKFLEGDGALITHEFRLMESKLKPSGAEYTTLESFPFVMAEA